MKKIIYSLVIMIAAGSLFTSCIEQVEPLGIQDMRFAKAEYIRALKDLRAADAEYVRAQAAFELARARYKDAQTANLNADTEYQKLLNEYQQLLNEARQDTNDFISQETANKIDSIKKRMELRELEHQKNMVAAQDSLANAQERLRVALRNIALYAQSLTPDEQAALASAVYMYETAFEVAAAQDIKVLKAQYKLDSLKAAAAVGDTVYDKSSKAYIGQVNKWKKDIEANEVEQALLLAILLAVPDSLVYDDVDGWKEQVDKLVADSTAAEYERYQTKIEMSQYYTANIHDGVDAFNDAVTVFQAENWIYDKDDPSMDPNDPATWAEPQALTKKEADTLSWGEPKQDDFKQSMDTIIVFPDLLKEEFTAASNYEKYVYLLSSYKQESKVSASGKNVIDEVGDTLRILKANQSLKDFILGAAGDGDDAEVWESTDGKKKMVASYGLKGALDVMKRVYKDMSNPLDTSKIGPAMRDADKKWADDHATLKAGFKAYKPFMDSLDAFKAAKNAANPTAMFTAAKALYDAFKEIDQEKDINKGDSTAILSAIEAFAAARDAYLDDNTEYAKGENPHYFYFSVTKELGEAVVDSVAFSEIATQTKFPAVAYQYDVANNNVADAFTAVENNEQYRRAALSNIIKQLFGVDKSAQLNVNGSTAMALNVGTDIMGTNSQLIKGLATYTLSDWSAEPKDMTMTPAGYKPEELTIAQGGIYTAIAKYNAVYNDYWNTSLPETKATVTAETTITTAWETYFNDPKDATLKPALTATFASHDGDLVVKDGTKANVGGLTAAGDFNVDVFKPFTKDEAPLVTFTSTKIDSTEALCVVLAAVDPKGWVRTTAIDGSAIFNGNATDFRNMMYYQYQYWLATHAEEFEQDTKVIEDWISAVEHAFALDAEKAGMPDTKAYEKAKKAYNRLSKKSKAYEAYETEKKAFTGEDEDGNANEIVTLTAPTVAVGTEFDDINDVLVPELVETNILGTYTGEWAEGLGGTQLELAKTLFPDYPENILEWDAEMEYADDITEEYGILIDAAKKAYFAAAKIAGENVEDAANWDELVENYKAANKAYRKRILDKIETLQEEIEQWEQNLAKWQVGAPAREIEIAETANALKVETARLKGYEEALAYAKANLDKLMEYIKSLDANFVIPAVDFGPDEDED